MNQELPDVQAKNLPVEETQEMRVRFLGWEDSLEKEMAAHSSILAREIPWTEKSGGPQSMGSQRIGHNWSNWTQRNQRSNCIHWIMEQVREFEKKHQLLLHWLCKSLWLYGITTNCGKFLKRWEYQTTLPVCCEICMQVRTLNRTTDWFKIGKGVRQGCILSPCLFNLYAEYIMLNAGLDDSQAGIKIAKDNLRYNGRKWRGIKEPLFKILFCCF